VAVAGTITPGTVARRIATGTIPGIVTINWGRAWPPSNSTGKMDVYLLNKGRILFPHKNGTKSTI